MRLKDVFSQHGDVCVIDLSSIPKGQFCRSTLSYIFKALRKAEGDPSVHGVVVSGALNTTPCVQFDETREYLTEFCNRIELFPKPVIAILKGHLQGHDLQIALAAHWRLATKGSRMLFAETALGLLPNAGVTLRLPRLVGVTVALEILLKSITLSAMQAAQYGLIDKIVTKDVMAEAVSFLVRGVKHRPTRERRECFAKPADYLQSVRAARARYENSEIRAETRVIDCVEAALLLPFEEALAFEAAAYEDCSGTPEARALCHLHQAQQRLSSRTATISSSEQRIGVLGGGASGTALAAQCLMSGLPVMLSERDEHLRSSAAMNVETLIMANLKAERISEEQALDALANFDTAVNEAAALECDIVLEALAVDAQKKKAFFQAVEAKLPDRVLLISATSYNKIDVLAENTKYPDRVLGVNFAQFYGDRVLEVVRGAKTSDNAIAQALGWADHLKVTAVLTNGVSAGDSVYHAYRRAMDRLCEAGASSDDIDRALCGAGFVLGPYQQKNMVAGGPPPMVLQANKALSAFSANEICRRAFAAMANEGARLVSNNVIDEASELDVIMVKGYGFPPLLGGPMHWANQVGLVLLRDDLRRWSSEVSEARPPAPLWDELIKMGGRF